MCTRCPDTSNPPINYMETEKRVCIKIHGSSYSWDPPTHDITDRPWFDLSTSVDWQDQETSPGDLWDTLVGPIVPKRLFNLRASVHDIPTVIQWLLMIAGPFTEIRTASGSALHIIRYVAMSLPSPMKGETITLSMDTHPLAADLVPAVAITRAGNVPVAENSFICNTTRQHWKIHPSSKAYNSVVAVLRLARSCLKERDCEVAERPDTERQVEAVITDPANLPLGTVRLLQPNLDTTLISGDASKLHPDSTVVGMAITSQGMVRMGATNADVSVGEVRAFLEAIRSALDTQKKLIYVTDSQFTVFAWNWAKKETLAQPKRALLHILQELRRSFVEEVRPAGLDISLVKAMSHVGCPSNHVADKYAKLAYTRAAGEKGDSQPTGVAANINIPLAICQQAEQSEKEDLIIFRYTGRMLAPPVLLPSLQPRHGFANWGSTAPQSHIKDGIDFATQLRMGLLYPHDWGQANLPHQTREDTGIICPLCQSFVLPNHSVACPTLQEPIQQVFRNFVEQICPVTNKRTDLIGILDPYTTVYVSRGWYTPAMRGVFTPAQYARWWKDAQGKLRAANGEYWQEITRQYTFKSAFKSTSPLPIWPTHGTSPDKEVDSPELAWWLIRTQQSRPEGIPHQQGTAPLWNTWIDVWWAQKANAQEG